MGWQFVFVLKKLDSGLPFKCQSPVLTCHRIPFRGLELLEIGQINLSQ